MNLAPGYNENSFSEDVIFRWGSQLDDLSDDANLLHPQMAALGRLCLSSPEVCGDILSFLEELLDRNDVISEIENAVAISFLQWPEMESTSVNASVAPRVANVVRTQWERFGSNS